MSRRGIARVTLVAVVLLVSVLAAGTVHGLPESLEVFVSQPAPDHVYKVGDTVSLTILVYNLGMAADADNLTVRLNPYTPAERWVIPAHTGPGAYAATFQIQSADVYPYWYYGGYSFLIVEVDGRIGSLSTQRTVSVRVGTLIEAILTPSSYVAAPGDRVDVGLLVRADGIPTDADAVFMNATRAEYVLASTSTPMTVARTGTGTYTSSYTIPASVHASATIAFSATVFVYANATYGSAAVYVPLPQKLEVWTHQVTANATSARIEVYAGNETGWPAVGANVTMQYSAFGFPPYQPVVDLSGTSDRHGRVAFNLTFPASSLIAFRGNVTHGSARQSYGGTAFPTSPAYPAAFVVQNDAVFPLYEVGRQVVLNYTVRYHDTLRAGQIVYYYASTSAAVIANGSATTDALGRFQISLVVPATSVNLEFSAEVDGVWQYAFDSILGVGSLDVHRGDFRFGDVTHVTGTTPMGPGPWEVVVLFIPYNFSAPGLRAPPTWLPGAYYAGPGNIAIASGSEFTYDLLLQRFLPKDTDYLFLVEMLPLNYSVVGAFYTPYVHAERLHLTNAPPTPAAALSSANILPGESLSVDMSGSVDMDGIVDAYRVEWGDGTVTNWTETAVARHAFSNAGDYTIRIQIRDDTGAIGEISRPVHVEATILGMRTTDFAILMGLVAVVAVAVAVLVFRIRRRPPVVARVSLRQTAPAAPPKPNEPVGPPENPPPPT